MYLSRRHFINLFTAGCCLPLINSCTKDKLESYDTSDDIFNYIFSNKINIAKDDILVFQGDSITDCNRNRLIIDANVDAALGDGYTMMITDNFLQNHTTQNVKFFNRGVAGNKVSDLADRWTTDCIDLNPSIVNILIGINDLRNNISPILYYNNYLGLLRNTKSRLPASKFIICEPFLFPNYPYYDSQFSTFNEYRKIVRLLARDFDAVFIPYHNLLLADEDNQQSYDVMSIDGFHPTSFGHSLMAGIWLDYLF